MAIVLVVLTAFCSAVPMDRHQFMSTDEVQKFFFEIFGNSMQQCLKQNKQRTQFVDPFTPQYFLGFDLQLCDVETSDQGQNEEAALTCQTAVFYVYDRKILDGLTQTMFLFQNDQLSVSEKNLKLEIRKNQLKTDMATTVVKCIKTNYNQHFVHVFSNELIMTSAFI